MTYTQCDKCGAVETTIASIDSICMFCTGGKMKEVTKQL